MKRNVSGKLSKSSRQMAIALVASGVVAATAVHANPSNNIVLVPPANLKAVQGLTLQGPITRLGSGEIPGRRQTDAVNKDRSRGATRIW
jgi:hypothetical protein